MLDSWIVFAEALVDVPVVSDLFDFRIFRLLVGRNKVWLFGHFFHFKTTSPIRYSENEVEINLVFCEKSYG